jgi:transcriptional regulator with XRE-family HTH domain
MNDFGDRLREERDRLGLSQSEMGEIGGVKKLAQLNYEKGERQPSASYLAAVACVGVDVMYVLTGQRIAPVPSNEQTRISRRESAMLDNYRACDEEDRKAIDRIALSAASPKEGLKKSG